MADDTYISIFCHYSPPNNFHMRKSILCSVLPLLAAICFNSCKKQISLDRIANPEIVAKVNTWLDANKPGKNLGHVANIEMLKGNLEFSQFRIEESSQNEQLFVIPINEKLKTEKNIDQNAVANLVLIVDASGKIRKGNIVLFFPEDRSVKRVPNNTFHAILNTAKPNANGVFRYLSVTGRTLHELEYREGRLKSFRKIENLSIGNSAPPNTITTNMQICVDWYWVYTEYDASGNIVGQWREYIGTTCQSESCSDPYNQSLCPPDSSSGGGQGDYEEYEVEAVKVAIYEWTVQGIPETSGGGILRETSRLVGKFFKRNTQNNRFLGLQGSSIMLVLSNWGQNGTVAWSNQIHTGIVNSNTQMTLSSSGRITFPNTEHYDYSGSKVVNLSDCHWPL